MKKNYSHSQKILCFEYIILKLTDWYKELNPTVTHPEYVFGKLKSLKLLFFVSTVNATEKNPSLLKIFDKFYAMAYGPVEGEIYDAILNKETSYFDIEDRISTIKSENARSTFFNELSSELKEEVDQCITTLKSKNERLVNLKPFQLVDISHKWPVWSGAMSIAQIFGKRSELMETSEILNSPKFYE
jgi:uncharacterized phage-associated protein